MRKSYAILLMLVALVMALLLSETSFLEASPPGPGISPLSYKTSPLPLPAAPISQSEIPQVVISIALQTKESEKGHEQVEPTYQVIFDSNAQEQQVSATPTTLHFPGQPLSFNNAQLPPSTQTASATAAGLVDNWDLLVEEDFEGVFPQSPCIVYDGSPDGYDRTWDDDSHRHHNGWWAGWPANGGLDWVDPETNDYPANLDSWLICGPFDLSNAQDFLVQYAYWSEISDLDDYLFVGASTDGHTFSGLEWGGHQIWSYHRLWFQNVAGDDSVWVAWAFHSDSDAERAEGTWIDDLQIWRYNTPDQACGNLDPGNKGMVLNPYESIDDTELPIIRAGDTMAADKLATAGVHWVRMVFRQRNSIVQQQEYDRMVDTLCARGISVLGVVNHETLARQDYNNETSAASYRWSFTRAAEFTAKRFAGRVTYWEVWNEPNLFEGPFIDPELYAPLLNDTYQTIKSANPQAQVLFGGLASAWGDSNQYFQQVYDELDNYLGGARPFDYFAVHPYARVDEGPNPQIYMYADQPYGYDTIVDKFMQTMSNNSDANKRVWITEVGWNSSKGSPNRPACLDPVLVYETEQAAYLKPMFDTLFNEVDMWGRPGTPAVDKVVWYQYMDTGTDDPCAGGQTVQDHVYVASHDMSAAGAVDWWFGLYRGDKITPKAVWCEYLAYPLTCDEFFSHHVHLPLVVRNY